MRSVLAGLELRFLSSPDVLGGERIAATKIPPEFLDSEYHELPSFDGSLVEW